MGDLEPSGRLFTPVVASIVRRRSWSIIFAVVGIIQVSSALMGVTLMPCPFLHVTGIPCPGCGASRASAALLRGRWREYARLHLFAPFFMGAILLFLIAGILPDHARLKLWRFLELIELRTKITHLLVAAAFFYWIGRLLYDRAAFIHLVGG